jgi:regulator of sirC expression with transglutaminase-like and TPR domain
MQFRDYAALPDERLDLLTGALLIARDEYPALDFLGLSGDLDSMAAPLVGRGLPHKPLALQIEILRQHLFVDLGFSGNTRDYYDPKNSFLNEVLTRRLGIPITLSVVYIEVARRLGVRVQGVGFPGHFLMRVDGSAQQAMVDPMSGLALDTRGLTRLVERALGSRAKLEPQMLSPTPVRHIVARMLMNLRGIYAERADYPRLLVVLDRLIDLLPDVANEVRDRGLLWAKLGAPRAALDDLKHYIESLPHAGDVADIRKLIEQLEKSGLAAPN